MQLVVPALSPRGEDGSLDKVATDAIARRAARTWADVFILNGTTTGGQAATIAERTQTVELWASRLPASRLVACCWDLEDADNAAQYGLLPMFAIQKIGNEDALLDYLAGLPQPHYLFSHPEYSPTALSVDAVRRSRERDILAVGAKVSKVSPQYIAEVRQASGADFLLWDGTSRHIEASLAAGADGVVAAALSHIPTPFPTRILADLQAQIDIVQRNLDSLGSRQARTAAIHSMAMP